MIACIHACLLQPCDVFVDTTGVGFAYPVVKLAMGIKVFSYTHYPTVSQDMLNTVQKGEIQFNNKVSGHIA